MRLLLFTLLLAPMLASAATLSVCTEASPEGFDVVQFNSLTTTNASADVLMDRLLDYDPTNGTLTPSLAQAWEVSADGLRIDFTLRQDVAFHQTDYFTPSRRMNADDVLFSFQRMLDPKHPWHASAANGYPHAQSMQWNQLIKHIEKLDSHRLRFTLNRADATFLSSLSMGFASIYSAEYAEQLQAAGTQGKLNSQPIGSGPFVLRRYQKDAVVRYRSNPDYWKQPPALDGLIYAITPDANVRRQKLRSGECHIALSPKPQDIASVRQDPRIQVSETPAFMTAFIALNTQHPPLDDPRVRQAINLAFDQESYLKAIFEGSASPAYSPLPSNNWGYSSDLPRTHYDPAKARELLAEAGIAKDLKLTLWTRPSGSLLNPNPSLSAQLLQADLAAIGIRADIRVIEWGELIRRAKAGEHDLLFMGWAGDNGDPDNFLTPLFSCAALDTGTNFSRYCDSRLDKLISAGKSANDRGIRSAAYRQALEIIQQQALWVPLANPNAAALLRREVSGYQANPFGRQDFSRVTLSP